MASVVNIINTITSRVIYLRTLEHIWVDCETITKGNNAVTARCRVINREGTWRIKCYTRHKANLRLIYGNEYYPNELGVYSIGGKIEYIDVVLQPWIEGKTLDSYIGCDDSDYVALSRAFDRLALDTLDAKYAHGDIKPENIIVGENFKMTLIDHDAMWRPEYKLYTAEEIGTEGYRHPNRDFCHYTKTIDDYPLAIIATTLAALALDYSAMKQHIKHDKTVLTPQLCINGKDPAHNEAMRLFLEHNDAAHYRIARGLQSPHIVINGLRDYFYYAFTPIHSPLPQDIVPERSNNLWGYRSCGEWVLPPLYDACVLPQSGKCDVILNGHQIELEVKENTTLEEQVRTKLHDETIEQEIDRKSRLMIKLKRDVEPALNILFNRSWIKENTRPNSGKRWTIYEDEILVCYIADGYSINTIARTLGRSNAAVRRHICDLNIPIPKRKRALRKPYIPHKRRK